MTYQRAQVEGQTISNPSLGRGVSYQVPPGFIAVGPESVLAAKSENQGFENYLRGIVASNNMPDKHVAFRESMLYRSSDPLLFGSNERYLVIFHVAMNLPYTFRSLSPQQRALLLPEVALLTRRYFVVPNKGQSVDFMQLGTRTVIAHRSFRIQAAGAAGQDWVGTGLSVMGDVTDIVAVYIFARSENWSVGQNDLDHVIAWFKYGVGVSAP